MNKHDWVEGLLFAGFRLLAAACLLAGLLGLVFALLDAWYRFDPNYLWNFLAATVLRPALVLIVGIVLHAASARLARRMASAFSRSST